MCVWKGCVIIKRMLEHVHTMTLKLNTIGIFKDTPHIARKAER